MNQQSYIPGYPTMITETMYKAQEDYLFVNNLKVKEFIYDSKFKREAEGPFIRDYYQHYEADKPQPNSLYSPLHIPPEDINRQCNPYVAYPFGVPHKYKKEKCPKCKGNSTFGKKKRSKKNKNNDLFTSSLKKEGAEPSSCWCNNLHSPNKNKPHSNCAINSYAQGNFKTASFKSADPYDSNYNEQNKKCYTIYKESFNQSSLKNHSNQIHEYEESNDYNKISSYQTEEYLMPTQSHSRNSLSCFTDTNKSPNNKNSLTINHSKLYTMSNPISEEIVMSNEFNYSQIPSEEINEKSSSKGKGKLYLKLNNNRINEYSNIISSGVSENNAADQRSERVNKTDDKTNKGRKKVKITVNRKIEKERKEEPMNTNENNEIINDTLYIPKNKKKSKINETDIEKNVNKGKLNAPVLPDLTLATEQDTKRSAKETTKRIKNKKTIPMRKISLTPSTSARKASGETYLRMCKMQLVIDAQVKNKQNSPISNKGILTSEDELFGSNSSRNTYGKSRVVYLQEKKKETNRLLSKEGNNNTNNNLLVSPRVRPILNSSVNSIPNSNLSVNTNISKNSNKSSNADINPKNNGNEEVITNSSLSSNLKKKKIVIPNKTIEKTLSKENTEVKSKKEETLLSPRKTGNVNKMNKIGNKNMYQKKNPIRSNISNKSSNPPTDRKTIHKNSGVSEIKNETSTSKKTTRKRVSGTVKNTNMSINKILTNNNVSDFSKYKIGLLKNKTVATLKNTSDNKKTGINSSNNNNNNNTNDKAVIDLHMKKLPTAPIKKKKISGETQKVVGNKNTPPQIKEENSGNTGSISDSALMNESDRSKPGMGVKFGRSETKLYMPNHKIVPFKTTEVKMVTKKDSGKLKIKAVPKISGSDMAMQRRTKEQNKKKINTSTNIQPTYVNKNTIKGNLKNKKKELYDNILLLTKGISKKNDVEPKTNGTGRGTKSSENKNLEHDSDSDPEISNNKIKRSQTNKDKKKEIIKKDKKEINKNIKKKEKGFEKKEKKIEDNE